MTGGKFYHYECKKVTHVTLFCCSILFFGVKSGGRSSFMEWGGMLAAAMFLKIMPCCRF